MKKTFLLGVGAQKAGTTWLYQYLRHHPQCAMGAIKEHAVLRSALAKKRPEGRFPVKVDSLISTLQSAKKADQKGGITESLQADLLAAIDNIAAEFDITYYLRSFERLLSQNEDAVLTGDITPEYCMLSREQLSQFRTIIEGAGYDLKVVFLMRDPLDRIYSALRMADRNRIAAGETVIQSAQKRFENQGLAEWVELRTRYEIILTNLDAAFEPEQVHTDFYETFFTQESLSRLLRFLGLSEHPANFAHMANASPEGRKLDPKQVDVVRSFYDETYRTCAKRFGEDFISQIWRYYKSPGF